ncbi:MAG: ATP-dependent DNA ligase [Candidatus Omnitrophica bacterium]|nr:ATP-dependent DNA ligase [Candidatus Omnitrophota bacterium]
MVKRPVYVIHEHHASHLHYDLRLEIDSVLKSWAIPKKPPLKKGIKRLAVQTEDHKLEYAGFEGEIAGGLYGAGKVRIWDKGYYAPLEMKDGAIVIKISGEKLNGTYCLIKLRPRAPKEKGKNWIFFKK